MIHNKLCMYFIIFTPAQLILSGQPLKILVKNLIRGGVAGTPAAAAFIDAVLGGSGGARGPLPAVPRKGIWLVGYEKPEGGAYLLKVGTDELRNFFDLPGKI